LGDLRADLSAGAADGSNGDPGFRERGIDRHEGPELGIVVAIGPEADTRLGSYGGASRCR
jgi:hypothetical protein